MKCIAAAVAILTLAGCGRSEHQPTEESRLQLVVGDTPITLQAGQSLALQLLVIGAGSEQATISSPDLPPFAVLQGSLLTLSPGRQYEGDYTMTLVATTQSSNASAVVHVTVTRPNTAPRTTGYAYVWGTNGGNEGGFCIEFGNCTLAGTPTVSLLVIDDDGDPVTVDVELVPTGQPFSGAPTQSMTQTTSRPAFQDAWIGVPLPLPGLVVGQSYSFSVRIRGALGEVATWPGPTQPVNGWVTHSSWRFVQGPR